MIPTDNEVVTKKAVRDVLEHTCGVFLKLGNLEEEWRGAITARANRGVLTESGMEVELREQVESARQELSIARAALGRNITNCPAAIAILSQMKDTP